MLVIVCAKLVVMQVPVLITGQKLACSVAFKESR